MDTPKTTLEELLETRAERDRIAVKYATTKADLLDAQARIAELEAKLAEVKP